jgi:competence transcription factor ComK
VSCVLNVANVCGLSILDWPFDFLSRLFVLCLVFSMLPMSVDWPFLIDPLIFSHVYLSCVLCSQCCHCLWIDHSWLTLWFSLTFICLVSCVLNVANVCRLSILDWPFDFLSRLFVLCLVFSMLSMSVDCPFLIDPLIFSHVYLSCVLCPKCCQCLWIVHSWLTLWFSLTFICLVSCVLNVVNVCGLSILYWPFDFLSRLIVLCLVS